MTNQEIILSNWAILTQTGVIKPENTINTYIGWRHRGFQVKKGEAHIAEFKIWVKSKAKKQKSEEEEESTKRRSDFILQTAYWFTDQQVEPIKKEPA